MQQILLQNFEAILLQNASGFLVQNATVIVVFVDFIKKMRQLFQIATFIIKCIGAGSLFRTSFT